MSESDESAEVRPICQLCGKPGPTVMAGTGQVVGVPVHMKCFIKEVTE